MEVFVHPQGICESKSVGDGTRIWAFAHVMTGATIGENCNIGGNVFVEAGAVIENEVTVKNGVQVWQGVILQDRVFVGPNVTFTNDLRPRSGRSSGEWTLIKTTVQTGATLGANSTIVCGNDIGRYAFIGAGAVVCADVPSYALIAGNPGRAIGWVCECAEPLNDELSCSCGLKYELVSDESGLQKKD